MKKFALIIISFFVVIACQNKPQSNLNDMIAQKKIIAKQIDSLNKQLILLDKSIAKLDTTQSLQLVTTISLKPTIFKHFIAIQGFVGTDKNSIIKPEVSGTIKAVLVKESQHVNKGDALIKLDDALIKDNIAEVKTQLALAVTTFNRQARLWEQKIGSEMQYLQAKANKESLDNKLATLKTQLSKSTITAPFSGTIDAIIPNIGELVSPVSPVIRLVNLDDVYVEADVSENYIGKIKKGDEAKVYFESLDKTFETKIAQVADFIDPNNRSFKVKIFINNQDQSLKPNLIATIKINDFTVNSAITLPSSIVQEDQKGNNFVYTLQQENKAYKVVKTLVVKGLSYNDYTYIQSGLTLNASVIEKGARGIKDGQIVSVLNQ